jgi:hypothetical protein
MKKPKFCLHNIERRAKKPDRNRKIPLENLEILSP